jgi:hypothetical protein
MPLFSEAMSIGRNEGVVGEIEKQIMAPQHLFHLMRNQIGKNEKTISSNSRRKFTNLLHPNWELPLPEKKTRHNSVQYLKTVTDPNGQITLNYPPKKHGARINHNHCGSEQFA